MPSQGSGDDAVGGHVADANGIVLAFGAVRRSGELPLLLPILQAVKPVLEDKRRDFDQWRIEFPAFNQRVAPRRGGMAHMSEVRAAR